MTKFALGSIEQVEKAGYTVRHIAKRGGKFLTITGFYFDVEELLHAKGNIKKIKALIEKADEEFKDIQDKITGAVKGFQRLQNILVTRAAAARQEIEKKRRERDDFDPAVILQPDHSPLPERTGQQRKPWRPLLRSSKGSRHARLPRR